MPSRPSWVHILVSWIGTAYLYLMGKTSFLQKYDNAATLPYRRRLDSCLYAFWHRYQVFLAYEHRGQRANILISRSKDGEYIAQVIKLLRLQTVRGSTSRGGEQALREIISRVKNGEQAAFTPDGPRGPVQTVHGGVIAAAQMTGQFVIPTAGFSRRAVIFKSWDRFMLPLPFGHNVVVHGKPFTIPEHMPLEEAKAKVRDALNAVSRLAEKINQESPSYLFLMTGQILFWIYRVLTLLLSPVIFVGLMISFGVKRSWVGLKERFSFQSIISSPKPRLWLHAASVGEWQALRPMIKVLDSENKFSLVITATTPEARALIEKERPDAIVSLLPVDLKWAVKRWLKKINPEALLIVETELWPTLIDVLSARHIPIFIVNGRLSEKSSRRWKWLKPFIYRTLRKINYVYARSEEDAKHFRELGLLPISMHVVGNTKSDNLAVVSTHDKKNARKALLGLVGTGSIIIAGSTWPGEEAMVLPVLNSTLGQDWRIILAPRRAERWAEVKELLAKQKHAWSLWSEVKQSQRWETKILLVDTLGDLGSLYKVADMCFVGGSVYPRGGQNPLEPAASGVPMIFGSSMNNFKDEAEFMVKQGAALQIEKYSDLVPMMEKCMADVEGRKKMAMQAVAAVQQLQGSSEKIIRDLMMQMGYERNY